MSKNLGMLPIRALTWVLVWGSLAAGAVSATTAYLASLDLPDERLVGLTLAAPAGLVKGPDNTVEPIAGKGSQEEDTQESEEARAKKEPQKPEAITAELLARLRDAEVENVRVNEFSWSRWRGRWYFVLSLAGLLAGGLLTRLGSRPAKEAKPDAAAADSPDRTIEILQETIDRLRLQLPEMPDSETRLDAIVEQIGELQKGPMEAFVDARRKLTASLGLGGYAALMDSYAAAERQINRAWSAAADGYYDEAVACLEEASMLVAATRKKLAGARAD